MILLVDIDHTVSDASWRDHLMGDWNKYHAASIHDKPIMEVVQVIKDLQKAGWRALGFTMRPARWRLITNTWLSQIATLKLETVLMREEDEWRPSATAKIDLLEKHFAGHDYAQQPIILLDDHGEVCAAFAKRNITVFQVFARRGVRNGSEVHCKGLSQPSG